MLRQSELSVRLMATRDYYLGMLSVRLHTNGGETQPEIRTHLNAVIIIYLATPLQALRLHTAAVEFVRNTLEVESKSGEGGASV